MDLFQLHGCGTALVTPFHTDGSLDEQAMRRLHRRLGPLMQVLFIESNPIPVKAALAVMGHIDPSCRLPLVLPRPENQAKVEKVVQELGLLAGKEKEYVAGREN